MSSVMPHDEDPVHDVGRLHAVSQYAFESTEASEAMSGLARRAAERLGMPIGLVSVVLDSAQYFAGMHGVEGWMAEAGGTPIEWSFCANAVRRNAPYVVEDAEADPLQHDNPLVTVDGIRSYAGAPLRTSHGEVLGALCVLGTEPHRFSSDDIAELATMADRVVEEMGRHRPPGAS